MSRYAEAVTEFRVVKETFGEGDAAPVLAALGKAVGFELPVIYLEDLQPVEMDEPNGN